MPVPAPNLYPDFNVIRLSHACLNVSDLVESKKFYTEILGLQVTDESDTQSIYVRWKSGASLCDLAKIRPARHG
ncbi:Hypothetical protein FKW44_004902 [Caligus rogercresseyi]|uniref:VOC domain-containing protein n=1 Tax=Caligus rogercresseyi TaxID=217165 RepID=A0A7T8KB62_CALRO|nr:Hypothetical protein FKW44_004902 [Caligus rogercresseyi]